MKKFNKLNQYLKNLELQKTNLATLDEVSLFQFIRYKYIVSKESKVRTQIGKIKSLVNMANSSYDTQIQNWINNPTINCMKYHKLQQRAEYQRDLKLYKLGYIDEKPLSPLLKKLMSHFSEINSSKFNFLSKSHTKHISTNSSTSSPKFDKLAISTVKIGIKGYRKLCSNYKFIRNYVASRNSIKYMKKIIEEAKVQIDASEIHKSFQPNSIIKKGIQFRESLRFTPEKIVASPTLVNAHKEKISYPSQKRRVVIDASTEYTL